MGDTKSVGANRESAGVYRDSFSDQFDERPDNGDIDGALYEKPSFLNRVGKWFNDVGIQFKAFFDGLGEGITSAWTAVKRAFGSEDQAQQAVRNINHPITAEAGKTFQSRESLVSTNRSDITSSIDRSQSALVPTATDTAAVLEGASSDASLQALQNATDAAALSESTHPDTSFQTLQSATVATPIHSPTTASVELNDEFAFDLFVDEFKQARREGREFSGAGRQQFEDAAKRHAQKLYDTEVKRLNDLGDQPGDYVLGADQALAIEVASALLHKPLPHQKLLDLTGQASVPPYSQKDEECFNAWVEWHLTKILPGGKAIDLEGAVRYAIACIAKNTSDQERVKLPEVSRRLEQAYELIQNRKLDATQMDAQVMRSLMAESRAALSRVPLPAFPNGVTTLALQPIKGGIQGFAIKAMIKASRDYFSAIREAEEPSESNKAQAILFATLWKAGKSDSKTLAEMKTWDFFGQLDQLLDVEKIKNDFK